MNSTAVFHRTNLDDAAKPAGSRPVILHFHTYKNSGSTVDRFLETCFPGAWANYDGPVPEFFMPHTEIGIIARNREQLKAISSHQIRLPVPKLPGVEFLPLVFIRRPELRAASIWRFEKQRGDDHPRTILAMEKGLSGWIEHALSTNFIHAIADNQAWMFGFEYDKRTPRSSQDIPTLARKNLASLEFIGLADRLDESMKVYERLYRPKVPDFQWAPVDPVNVTGNLGKPIDDQLENLRNEIGDDLFSRLQEVNAIDIELYEMAERKLSAMSSS